MLSGARVRRNRDKRKPKHPEDAFSVQLASGNSTHAFCVLSCWRRGYKKSEQVLGRIPCYGMAQGRILGVLRLPLGRVAPSEFAQDDRGKEFLSNLKSCEIKTDALPKTAHAGAPRLRGNHSESLRM